MSDVLVAHERRLADAGVDTPAVDVRLLAAHALGVPARRLRAALARPADEALRRLDDLVARRGARVPVQHLVGAAAFRDLELEVRPGVFVPRPETEVVAGVALEALRARPGRRVIVEPGTGGGAIALTLAVEEPGARVVATEIDPAAARLAERNLDRVRRGEAGVDGLADGASVDVLEGDLLGPVSQDLRGGIDLLVSNPPYLPAADRATLPPEVVDHDPHHALFGGPDGHEIVDRLTRLAAGWLAPRGALVLEIDDRRGPEALAGATDAGLVDARVVADLTGRDRVLVARRAEDR